MSSRRRFVSLLLAAWAAFACAKQGEGERCNATTNGNQDCESHLVCVKATDLANTGVGDRCCPPEGQNPGVDICIRSAGTGGTGATDGGSGSAGQAGSDGGAGASGAGGTAGQAGSGGSAGSGGAPDAGTCLYDSDCPGTLVCGPTGMCQAECKTNKDCTAPEVCLGNQTCGLSVVDAGSD